MTQATPPSAPVRRTQAAAVAAASVAGASQTSTAAIHHPVHAPAPETNTSELPIGQLSAIVMPDEGLPERGEVIEPVDGDLLSDHTQRLLFAEEPVTIIINKSAEKFAPLTVDCWCNGKGAEVLTDGRWMEFGWLPVERRVTTKRKYVEILARSKQMSIRTEVGDMTEEKPKNEILRSNSLKAQFSVIGDTSRFAAAWLQQLMAEQV
jgi:hypothetical protein